MAASRGPRSFAAERFRSFGGQSAQTSAISIEQGPTGLLVRADSDLRLDRWLAERQEWLKDQLLIHGVVLFRGFHLESEDDFIRAVEAGGAEAGSYEDAHTPRTQVSRGLYTSTEYPANHEVPMHSENSKNRSWPRLIWFYCMTAATSGGATPIADNRRVLAEISESTRAAFAELGVKYVRRLGLGLGLSWQKVLGTDKPDEVEARCDELGLQHRWDDDGSLELAHLGSAIEVHPDTGDELWFNQANLFHRSALTREARAALDELSTSQKPPSDVFFGDGSAIPESMIEEINEAFAGTRRETPWVSGDVLAVENMLIAHGRRPYTGERRVLVAMNQGMPASSVPLER